jgi:hypothetical protein
MRWTVLIIVVAALIASQGCWTDRPDREFFAPEDIGTLVVDAVLVVGKPLPEIVLSRAIAPDGEFSIGAAAESRAIMELTVEPDGPVVEYVYSLRHPYFVPEDDYAGLIVLPRTTYTLRIVTIEDERLFAQTTTPGEFSVDRWLLLDDTGTTVQRTLRTFEELGEGVYFAPENQLVYTQGLLEGEFVRSPDTPGYHVGIFSLDPESDFVIDPAFFEDDDFAELERTISSPAFEWLDGRVRLPWFAIFFQGRYKIKVFAVDENWYRLILTLPEFQSGFGGNVGDFFNRPSFNIEGGIGLFGSASVDSVGFFILPRP